MNNNDYKAFLENDLIARDFITAILVGKLDALKCGDSGLNKGTGRELKTLYYNIANDWLKNYFDNYSDWDYSDFKKTFVTPTPRANILKINKGG
jgi:hypothetical protein